MQERRSEYNEFYFYEHPTRMVDANQKILEENGILYAVSTMGKKERVEQHLITSEMFEAFNILINNPLEVSQVIKDNPYYALLFTETNAQHRMQNNVATENTAVSHQSSALTPTPQAEERTSKRNEFHFYGQPNHRVLANKKIVEENGKKDRVEAKTNREQEYTGDKYIYFVYGNKKTGEEDQLVPPGLPIKKNKTSYSTIINGKWCQIHRLSETTELLKQQVTIAKQRQQPEVISEEPQTKKPKTSLPPINIANKLVINGDVTTTGLFTSIGCYFYGTHDKVDIGREIYKTGYNSCVKGPNGENVVIRQKKPKVVLQPRPMGHTTYSCKFNFYDSNVRLANNGQEKYKFGGHWCTKGPNDEYIMIQQVQNAERCQKYQAKKIQKTVVDTEPSVQSHQEYSLASPQPTDEEKPTFPLDTFIDYDNDNLSLRHRKSFLSDDDSDSEVSGKKRSWLPFFSPQEVDEDFYYRETSQGRIWSDDDEELFGIKPF